jgi:ferredoxin
LGWSPQCLWAVCGACGSRAPRIFKVDDNTTYCGTFDYASEEQAQGIATKPGEQVVIGYLRTRTTLWLMSKGKRSELKQPENWSLPIEKVEIGS